MDETSEDVLDVRDATWRMNAPWPASQLRDPRVRHGVERWLNVSLKTSSATSCVVHVETTLPLLMFKILVRTLLISFVGASLYFSAGSDVYGTFGTTEFMISALLSAGVFGVMAFIYRLNALPKELRARFRRIARGE